MTAPVCPSCGKAAERQATRYGVRHACCGLHSWDGKPLVDEATHRARRKAHDAFDHLWKSGAVRRKRAYALLREELGITSAECHMALMPRELAERVPLAVDRIWKLLDAEHAEAARARGGRGAPA